MKEATDTIERESFAPVVVGGETWEWTGETCGRGSPVYTNGKARGIHVHGGMLNYGTPGQRNGGRRPESIRIAATEGVEKLLPQIIASTEKQAAIANSPDATPDARGRAHAEAIRGFRGLIEAGPGTKVTNVVERDGYHDAASRAYDRSSDKLTFLVALKEELDAIP